MTNEIKEDIITKFVFNEEQSKTFGNNEEAIVSLIRFFEKLELDEITINFSKDFTKLLDYNENFKIFYGEKITGYMPGFKALNISSKIDKYVLAHELGHTFLNLIDDTRMPEDFEQILTNAKKKALVSKDLNIEMNKTKFNCARFRTILEYICEQNKSFDGVGPFSDTISSMWQTHGFPTIEGGKLILPYCHTRDYYADRKNNEMIDYKKVYDEQFANFFSLYLNGEKELLNTLRSLFGEEWYLLMENKLISLSNELNKVNEKSSSFR